MIRDRDTLDRPTAAQAAQPRPVVVVAVEPIAVGAEVAGRMFGMSGRAWQRLAAVSEVPAPLLLGGKRLWTVEVLKRWAAAGCPTGARWKEVHDGP